MSAYLFPIKSALITFPFLAFFLTLPFSLYHYRKYGYINKFRTFIFYTFLLYLLVSFYLIILPLPSSRDVKAMQRPGTQHTQLIPFNFVKDIISEGRAGTSLTTSIKKAIASSAFMQAAFNGILLLPFGVYLRYYFRKKFPRVLMMSFLMSLFFELTQLSALYGFYNAPYRLFDVDDLFLNTLGGVLGYLLTPMLTFFLPDSSKLDEGVDLEKMPVGMIRRYIAILIDAIIVCIPASIVFMEDWLIPWIIISTIYYTLSLYFFDGKTIGKHIVRIKVVSFEGKMTFKSILKRSLIVNLGIPLPLFLAAYTMTLNTSGITQSVIMLAQLIYFGWIFMQIIAVTFSKKKILFYEEFSQTKNIIDKKLKA